MTLVVHAAPYGLVCIAGIAIALSLWRRSPTACGLAIFALSLKLMSLVSGFFVNRWVVAELARGTAPQTVGQWSGAINLIQSLVGASVLALLLASIIVALRRAAARPAA